MNPAELRINNLVKDSGGKTLRIDWFERGKVCQRMMIDGKEVHPLTEDFEHLKLIPLTVEWLEKLGFEWYEPLKHWRNVVNDLWFTVSTINFSNVGDRFVFSFTNLAWDETQSMPFKVVETVDKLQNLFFYLSGGQELELK